MRTIRKNVEPSSLTQYREAGGGTYDDYPHKQTLRTSLVNEQRGLCCYCMCEIRPEPGAMKIEHWHAQSNQARQLDYSNLLASCNGGEGQTRKKQHCDTRKGDRDLSRNPADPNDHVEQMLRYLGNGEIYSIDPVFDAQIKDVLNLNFEYLKESRKAALDGFSKGPSRAIEASPC